MQNLENAERKQDRRNMRAILDTNFLGKSHIKLIFTLFKANGSSFLKVFKTTLCWHNPSPKSFLIEKKWKTSAQQLSLHTINHTASESWSYVNGLGEMQLSAPALLACVISTELLIFLQALVTVTAVTAPWSSAVQGRPRVWSLSCHGATARFLQRRAPKVGSKGKLTCQF